MQARERGGGLPGEQTGTLVPGRYGMMGGAGLGL